MRYKFCGDCFHDSAGKQCLSTGLTVDSVDLRIETNQRLWYAKGGTTNITVGGCLRLCRGQPMISWMELLTYTLVIIGIIDLCIQINNKK